MTANTRTPCVLPEDYLQRWHDMAEWSIKHEHGPAARYALMFALTLRRSVLADRAHITYVSPRIWEVKDRLCTSQRVAIFSDGLMHKLLDLVDATADYPTPLFPHCACGSHRTDEWAHGLASRKLYRGHTNFQALCVEFNIEAGPKWTPLEIYLVSLCVFRTRFKMIPHDECRLLMNQLGLATPKQVFYHSHWFQCANESSPFGCVGIKDRQTVFTPESQTVFSVLQAAPTTCREASKSCATVILSGAEASRQPSIIAY